MHHGTTTIGPYRITLETCDEGRPHAYIERGPYSGSWEALEGDSGLFDNRGRFQPAARGSIDAIERRLEDWGYFD